MMAKLCPLCHTTNADDRIECRDCGYVFGQAPDVLRGQLRSKIRGAKIGVLALVLVNAIALAVLLFMVLNGFPVLMVGLFTIPLTITIRLANKLLMWRASLKSIDAQYPELPKARVVE